jgi:hypothetical protein
MLDISVAFSNSQIVLLGAFRAVVYYVDCGVV